MKKRIIFDFDGVLADSLSVTMDNINFLCILIIRGVYENHFKWIFKQRIVNI